MELAHLNVQSRDQSAKHAVGQIARCVCVQANIVCNLMVTYWYLLHYFYSKLNMSHANTISFLYFTLITILFSLQM